MRRIPTKLFNSFFPTRLDFEKTLSSLAGTIAITGYIGVIISGLVDNTARVFILGFFENVIKTLFGLGCFGAPFAIIGGVILLSVVGTLGVLALIVYLWFVSLLGLFKGASA
jgi:hypothetical protein